MSADDSGGTGKESESHPETDTTAGVPGEDEPLGNVHSATSRIRAFRYQVSKYGYLRGTLRHAKRQAVRWREVISTSAKKGEAKYRAESNQSGSVSYIPGVAVIVRGGGATGPRSIYTIGGAIGGLIGHYLRILLMPLIFLVLAPMLALLGVAIVIWGLFELDVVALGGGVAVAVACIGLLYWLRGAETGASAG